MIIVLVYLKCLCVSLHAKHLQDLYMLFDFENMWSVKYFNPFGPPFKLLVAV